MHDTGHHFWINKKFKSLRNICWKLLLRCLLADNMVWDDFRLPQTLPVMSHMYTIHQSHSQSKASLTQTSVMTQAKQGDTDIAGIAHAYNIQGKTAKGILMKIQRCHLFVEFQMKKGKKILLTQWYCYIMKPNSPNFFLTWAHKIKTWRRNRDFLMSPVRPPEQ